MNIKFTKTTPSFQYSSRPLTSKDYERRSAPQDKVTLGSLAGEATIGAVTFGVPGALGIGAAKSFMGGNALLGVGLAAAGLASMLPLGIAGVMHSAAEGRTGLSTEAFMLGGALAVAGAATAIF